MERSMKVTYMEITGSKALAWCVHSIIDPFFSFFVYISKWQEPTGNPPSHPVGILATACSFCFQLRFFFLLLASHLLFYSFFCPLFFFSLPLTEKLCCIYANQRRKLPFCSVYMPTILFILLPLVYVHIFYRVAIILWWLFKKVYLLFLYLLFIEGFSYHYV